MDRLKPESWSGVFTHSAGQSAKPRRIGSSQVVSWTVHALFVATALVLPHFFLKVVRVSPFNIGATAVPAPPTFLPAQSAQYEMHTTFGRLSLPVKLSAPTLKQRPTVAVAAPEMPLNADTKGSLDASGDVLRAILNETDMTTIPMPDEKVSPIQIGGQVTPAKPLYSLVFDYPIVAAMGQSVGSVLLEAVIDEAGRVRGVRAISGPDMLVPAAISALAKERFEPARLDGSPTPCRLKVSVIFNLRRK
jgi:hypothetical protein